MLRGLSRAAAIAAVAGAACASLVVEPSLPAESYAQCKDLKGSMRMYWTLNATHLALAIEAPLESSQGWIGVGVSPGKPQAKMVGSDLVIAYPSSGLVADYVGPTEFNTHPLLDDIQSLLDVKAMAVGGTFRLSFVREVGPHALIADAKGDLDWANPTQTLMFAVNDDPAVPGSANGQVDGFACHTWRGFVDNFDFSEPSTCSDNLVDPTDFCARSESEPNAKKTVVRLPPHKVGREQTQLACMAFDFPNDTKVHAVRFDALLEHPAVLHHMLLYRCEADAMIPVPKGEVFDCLKDRLEGCEQVIWVWEVGGQESLCPPPEAGIPLGLGHITDKGLVLEVHYNNPDHLEGIVDESGVIITHTEELREKDVGIHVLGVPTDEVYIPPLQERFEMIGRCQANFSKHLWPNGLTVWAQFFHMHIYGHSIYTEQFRNGVKIGEIGNTPRWDFFKQSIVFYSPYLRVEPGDEFVTHCVFTTANSTVPVKGGMGADDEMCYNFLYTFEGTGSWCMLTDAIRGGDQEQRPIHVAHPAVLDTESGRLLDQVEDNVESLLGRGSFVQPAMALVAVLVLAVMAL